MEDIKDFFIDQIKEKYIVEEIFQMKERMEKLEEWDAFIETSDNNWINIARTQNLSEEFMREFFDKLNDVHFLYWIIMKQQLSEEFMREFQDKFLERAWYYITREQQLSEEFMREIQYKFDKSCWQIIFRHKTLSGEFKREFRDRLW